MTQPEFRDYSPAFDPEGRFLYFLSIRTFDPVYDSVQFELSFPRAARPYLVALQAGGPPPFDPMPKGLSADDPRRGESQAGELPLPPVELAGIERRIAPFPVAENRFGQIAGVLGKKVVWTVLPIVGAHGRGGHKEAPGRLEVFDFATLRAETLLDKADRFALGGDYTTLVVRDGKRLRAIAPTRKPETEREAAEARGRAVAQERLDRSRAHSRVGRAAPEWRQMLREVWRLQRDHFWVPDMSGVDWEGVYRHYEPLLDRVATRAELSDLIWEMQGELGTSHAYEMAAITGARRKWRWATLPPSCILSRADGSYEITRIVTGDPWDAGADSPLNAVGVEARPGERIVAVNGQRTSRERPPQALLVHQAGAKVELTLATIDGQPATRNVSGDDA